MRETLICTQCFKLNFAKNNIFSPLLMRFSLAQKSPLLSSNYSFPLLSFFTYLFIYLFNVCIQSNIKKTLSTLFSSFLPSDLLQVTMFSVSTRTSCSMLTFLSNIKFHSPHKTMILPTVQTILRYMSSYNLPLSKILPTQLI